MRHYIGYIHRPCFGGAVCIVIDVINAHIPIHLLRLHLMTAGVSVSYRGDQAVHHQ